MDVAAAGEALAKFPEVAYAAATTGPANLAETAPIIRTVKQAPPTTFTVTSGLTR